MASQKGYVLRFHKLILNDIMTENMEIQESGREESRNSSNNKRKHKPTTPQLTILIWSRLERLKNLSKKRMLVNNKGSTQNHEYGDKK